MKVKETPGMEGGAAAGALRKRSFRFGVHRLRRRFGFACDGLIATRHSAPALAGAKGR